MSTRYNWPEELKARPRCGLECTILKRRYTWSPSEPTDGHEVVMVAISLSNFEEAVQALGRNLASAA